MPVKEKKKKNKKKREMDWQLVARYFTVKSTDIFCSVTIINLSCVLSKAGIEEADLRQDQSAIEMETKLFTTRLTNEGM